jgi:nicotinate phosphoribosyltransferase
MRPAGQRLRQLPWHREMANGKPDPDLAEVPQLTDNYFLRTKAIVEKFGDKRVVYAVFLRRPVIAAPRLMVNFLERAAAARDTHFEIELVYPEGAWVGAGQPMIYITGSLRHLVDLETLYLQRLGAPCVAAYNAYTMCLDLPKVAFLAMDARHCAGAEMAEMMAYAAAVGSAAAKREVGVVGFIGNANTISVAIKASARCRMP